MRLLLAIPLTVTLVAQTYEIRPAAGSRVALEVFKTGLLSGKKHLFLFEKYSGKLHFDASAPERSRVELTIETASIVCKDTWIGEKDIRKVMETATGREMLEVARYPAMRFVSTAVTRSGDGFEVRGGLTIRGQEHGVIVTVTMKPQGDGLQFNGKSEVRLKDYGLKPPSAALGAIGTRNEMPVEFSVVATRN